MKKSLRRLQIKPVNRGFNWFFVGLVLLLTLFGLVMVFDASIVEAYTQFGNQWHFVRLQAFWASIGLIVLCITTLTPYKLWAKISLPLFIGSLLLLILVLIPGVGNKVNFLQCF